MDPLRRKQVQVRKYNSYLGTCFPEKNIQKNGKYNFSVDSKLFFCQVSPPPHLHLFLYKQRILLKSASSNSLKNVDSKYKVIIYKYNIIIVSLASLISFLKKCNIFEKIIYIKRMIWLFQQAHYEDITSS